MEETKVDQVQAKQKLMSEYIGRKARVVTKNNRIFQGTIMCIDYKANVILHQAIAEIPKQHNCPLNYQLFNYTDQKLEYQPPKDLSEQEKMKAIKQYFGSHYYFGAIMVAGKDIKSFELSSQKPPKKEGQKDSQKKQQTQNLSQKKKQQK